MNAKNSIIVGAGLTGSLLSIFLARHGYQVDVYERRQDLRQVSSYSGRSINMALSKRGVIALEKLGLDQQILAQAIPMKGRMIHKDKDKLSFAPYGKNEKEVIYSISRGGLNAAILDATEGFPSIRLHFEKQCLGMNLSTEKLNFLDCTKGHEFQLDAKRVFDTEGSTSSVRSSWIGRPRYNFSQSYLEHSYKELTIPPGKDDKHQMEKHALHIWPMGSYMLIALPNLDGSFTCTLFLPLQGELSFENLKTAEDVRSFFQDKFPDAYTLMPTLAEDFFHNPTGNLVTVKCFPWNYQDQVLLLGDAAHAIVPFYGQGMNCSFEDCTILNECIETYGHDWNKIFLEYQKLRKENTDAIADLAIDNFIEMRDLVADPKFLLKKELEHKLEENFPYEFISKYSMVTFHDIPYAEAMKKGRIQDSVLERLCHNANTLEELNLDSVKEEIDRALNKNNHLASLVM